MAVVDYGRAILPLHATHRGYDYLKSRAFCQFRHFRIGERLIIQTMGKALHRF